MLSFMPTPGDAHEVCCGFLLRGAAATQMILEKRTNGFCEGGRIKMYDYFCEGRLT